MDISPIDSEPIRPGYGRIWQSGAADSTVDQLPGPLFVVVMNRGEIDEPFIDHKAVEGIVAMWIDDSPEGCLSDVVFLALVDALAALVSSGMNLLIHCAAGVSRASYCDIGLHMRLMRMDYDHAFGYIKLRRPVASPNSGFEAQLRRLQPHLNP